MENCYHIFNNNPELKILLPYCITIFHYMVKKKVTYCKYGNFKKKLPYFKNMVNIWVTILQILTSHITNCYHITVFWPYMVTIFKKYGNFLSPVYFYHFDWCLNLVLIQIWRICHPVVLEIFQDRDKIFLHLFLISLIMSSSVYYFMF